MIATLLMYPCYYHLYLFFFFIAALQEQLKTQALELAFRCLSYDFLGTAPEDSQEDLVSNISTRTFSWYSFLYFPRWFRILSFIHQTNRVPFNCRPVGNHYSRMTRISSYSYPSITHPRPLNQPKQFKYSFKLPQSVEVYSIAKKREIGFWDTWWKRLNLFWQINKVLPSLSSIIITYLKD